MKTIWPGEPLKKDATFCRCFPPNLLSQVVKPPIARPFLQTQCDDRVGDPKMETLARCLGVISCSVVIFLKRRNEP